MQKPTLLILAAGMASRYGSMKQIQEFGPGGETIMDYSIYDAIRAGFGKVVCVIRKDFEKDFREIFDPKLQGKVEVEYVFQELGAYIGNRSVPEGRTKPWGTAHAVLCASDVITGPFAVINADDFYGRVAFVKAADFLNTSASENNFAIIGYDLLNTLSKNGTVNRGVVGMDATGNLATVTERLNICEQDGKIIADDGLEPREISRDAKVSMNFWCFHPFIFEYSKALFEDFLDKHMHEAKSEFFIPIVADQFIASGKGKIDVIGTDSKWFGVTYKEDAPEVKENLQKLIEQGEYPSRLWEK